MSALAVRLLEPDVSGDHRLVEQLTDLINVVYATAESGLWVDGTTRTTTSDVAELIAAGEIAIAARDGELAGTVRIRDVADATSQFGMLTAAPDRRGEGIGRALVAFAERISRERGSRTMQLELLVPAWPHPTKEFLKAWYGHCGYRHARTATVEDAHPYLAPLLATPCVIEVYEKPLRAER